MTKDDVLAALPSFELEDLTVIHAITAKLIQGRTAPLALTAGTLPALAFQALSGPLNVTQSYQNVAGGKWGKQFEAKIENLGKWLDLHFDGWSVNKITQLAFLQWLFTLLSNDLKRRNLPRSLAMVVTNLEQIPRIIENAYPGYLQAGLGKLILSHFQKPM